ncbi:hypothetical protein SAMN04487926_101305 [Paraburkholderia steynii]|uniref:Uncharacterized protein n=1 Tax=Paraburkholderia steynii TaxID=1245441 RepID=A0A7Z7B022_9BURK|nr:hypothetical protein SAMN04487926_101305 [Paraburkholderia steynii]
MLAGRHAGVNGHRRKRKPRACRLRADVSTMRENARRDRALAHPLVLVQIRLSPLPLRVSGSSDNLCCNRLEIG